ncbi:MAG: hypothetical protein J0H66_06330 [Solirubrobacterales bacterium]|nr:hypothetical protein [Solirubrobacterales bacterium]OJU94949.1 MAG: hypothetical protein BGO23_07210 [Solirubrobacterales bacterium 67-14]
MVKVGIAIALVFLFAALSVFGSPFFAILLLIPAVMIYLALVGGAVVAEEAGDDAESGSPEASKASRR